jgi:protease-4
MLGRLLIACVNLMILLRNSGRRLLRRRVDYVYLEISGKLPELADDLTLLQRLMGRTATSSLHELRGKLRRIAADRHARGVILSVSDFSPGWATAEGLREAVDSVRGAGKQVIAYLSEADTRTYYALCNADKLLMPPTAMLYLLGLRTEAVFLRDALRQLGIEAEVTAVSPYKSGGDTFTRTDMSPESREQLERLLDQRYTALVQALASARSVEPETARSLIDRAPYKAEAARAVGLLDYTCYEDELGDWLKQQQAQPDQPLRVRKWRNAAGALRVPYRRYWPRSVAVVRVEGAITTGESRSVPLPLPLLGGEQAGSESITRALRQLESSPRIGALVLHIDSPGGDAFASDVIWREVLRVSQQRPVVVSMGNVAASGGYYIAAAASAIVASPGTLTGSIGVFALRPVVADLLHRSGVNLTTLQRGARAGLLNINQPPDEDERAVLRQLVDDNYADFRARVCAGRGLSDAELEPLAGGRVWTGREAHEHKLVDELGGLPAAVARARELAGLPPDERAPLAMIRPGRRRSPDLPPAFPNDTLELLRAVLRPRIFAALPWVLWE